MKNFPKIAVQIADLLLPRPEINYEKWAVIACDQFTSQPEYWAKVKKLTAGFPSTYNMILPEVYLGKPDESEHVQLTHKKMHEYLSQGIFMQVEGLILTERSVGGKSRHGLVLALDLEMYNYSKGSQSLIRATEGTILERLPPRIKIRQGAPLELPHILVLIDDEGQTVIEPLLHQTSQYKKFYDFDLMLDSGHLSGHLIDDESSIREITQALTELSSPEVFYSKYRVNKDQGVLLFAMGDGNHSLATAKAIWERIRPSVGMQHPARYALVEVENLHDPGLEFEPIHRVLFDVQADFRSELTDYFGEKFAFEQCLNSEQMIGKIENHQGSAQVLGIISSHGFGVGYFQDPKANLAVGTIQPLLDQMVKNKKAREIDYVHGKETVLELGVTPGNIGIYLPAMRKSELFKTVIVDGVLPRKTFSMGEAHEKRFYVECRKIIE